MGRGNHYTRLVELPSYDEQRILLLRDGRLAAA
jgi:hypothetical protein